MAQATKRVFSDNDFANATAAPTPASGGKRTFSDADFVDSTPAKPQSSLWDKAKSLLPSPRTAATAVGAGIGGLASIPAYASGPGGVLATGLAGSAGAIGGGALYDAVTGTTPTLGSTTEDALGGMLQELNPGQRIANSAEKRIGTSIERAIGDPTSLKEINATEKALPVLSKDKDFPVAGSLKSLNKQLAARADDLTNQLNSAWNQLPPQTPISTTQARVELMKAWRNLFNSDRTIIKGAEKMERETADMIQYLQQHPAMNPRDIRLNRKLWDEMVNWHRPDIVGSSAEPEKDEVYRIAGNGLRSTISNQFPNIARLNDQVSAYINVSKIADKQAKLGFVPKMVHSLYRAIPEIGGLAAGATAGRLFGDTGAGAMVGGAAVGLRELMNTTAYQTASIPVKKQVVRFMNNGMIQEALGLLAGQAPKALEPGTSVDLLTGQEQ